MTGPVRVLIVDDSSYMRVVLKDMLDAEDGIEVVGTAKDGVEGVSKAKSLAPDVILLDIQMPKMDGLAALQRIMKESPTRVLMLSAMNKVDVHLPLRALEMGAVDFIPKPSGPVSIDIVRYRKIISDLVRNAASAKVEVLKRLRGPIQIAPLAEAGQPEGPPVSRAVVMAASTGGPRSLEAVLAVLPKKLHAPIVIVQHIPSEFSQSLAKRLDAAGGPKVMLATDGTAPEPGKAYLAPGGYHTKLEAGRNGKVVVRLEDSEPVQFVKPSANVLFESASRCYGKGLLGVVMTGMGSDGAQGARAIRAAGGRVVAQDEASSVIFGMARAVIAEKAADEVVPLEKIPERIVSFTEA